MQVQSFVFTRAHLHFLSICIYYSLEYIHNLSNTPAIHQSNCVTIIADHIPSLSTASWWIPYPLQMVPVVNALVYPPGQDHFKLFPDNLLHEVGITYPVTSLFCDLPHLWLSSQADNFPCLTAHPMLVNKKIVAIVDQLTRRKLYPNVTGWPIFCRSWILHISPVGQPIRISILIWLANIRGQQNRCNVLDF
jgi:hypothetical protein